MLREIKSGIVKLLFLSFVLNRKLTIFAQKMKYDEIHRLARQNGWEVLRQSGSHVIYREGTRTYPIPYHQGKEMGKGLERKIKKEMHLV